MTTIERAGRVAHFAYEHKKMAGYALGAAALAVGLNFGINSLQRLMIDSAAAAWAEAMKARLEHPENEKHFTSLKVVGAGRTLAEKLDMERKGGPVNVRNMAGFSFEALPGLALEVPVIGQISTGSDVYNVILVNGWGVAKCDNIKGLILKAEQKKAGQKHEICAINTDYLLNQNGVVK